MEENISRKEAIRRAVRSFGHELRETLQSDIKAFNSRLHSKFLIEEEVREKEDIDATLKAIRVRLKNDAVTESTFNEFVKAIGERTSREHLATKLLDLVEQQFKGEAVFLTPPLKRAITITPATHGVFSENHDASCSPAQRKQVAETEDRRQSADSALGRDINDFEGDELSPEHVPQATDNNHGMVSSGTTVYPQKNSNDKVAQTPSDLVKSMEEEQRQCRESLRMPLKEEQKRCQRIEELEKETKEDGENKAVSIELKEEAEYATSDIPEQYQSNDLFASSPIPKSPGSIIPPPSPFQPGTPSWVEKDTRRDSVLSTSTATEGEVYHVSGGHAQASDQDEYRPDHPMTTGTAFDRTVALLEERFGARILKLEKQVEEFESLKLEITGGLHRTLEIMKKEQFDIKRSLDQKAQKYELKELQHLRLYEQKKEEAQIQLEEQRRLLESEYAYKRARLERESADARVKMAEESAEERVRLVKKSSDEKLTLLIESVNKQVRVTVELTGQLEEEKRKVEQYHEKSAACENFENSSGVKELGKSIEEMKMTEKRSL